MVDPDTNRNKDRDYTRPLSADDIAIGRHRRRIGGRNWEQRGLLQFEFLVAQGLEPGHSLLDVGCGPLRAGVHFVEFLEPGHYYGIDINETLLDAGYETELTQRYLQSSGVKATSH